MSVNGWSNEELAALGKRLGGQDKQFGEQTLGTALTALALANRSAVAMTYNDWDTSKIELQEGLDESVILRILDGHLDWTATAWARNLLYNCVTNSGTDFAPANYRETLLQAAADADSAAAAAPGLDAEDKRIIAGVLFGRKPAAEPAGVSILEMATTIATAAQRQYPTNNVLAPSPEEIETAKAKAALPYMGRDETIKSIRASLKARSKTPWSVKHDTGTASGWITITAAPRVNPKGWMSDEQAAELTKLLGLDSPVHKQGYSIPAANDFYIEGIDRAAGVTPRTYGSQYWD